MPEDGERLVEKTIRQNCTQPTVQEWASGKRIGLRQSHGLRQIAMSARAKTTAHLDIHKRFFPYRWLTCCSRVSSHLPPVSFMSSESHLRSKRRDGVLAGLGAAIPILSTVKDACGFPPAQIALSSACTLLTIIKVHSLLFFNEELPIHVYSGHHEQQTRLSRSRTVLR